MMPVCRYAYNVI